MSHEKGFERLGIDVSRIKNKKTSCPNCLQTRSKKSELTLYVNLENGSYHCHRAKCGWKGRADSNEWIEKQHESENKPTNQIQATKTEQKRIESYTKTKNEQKHPSNPFIKSEPNKTIQNYFKGRKIGKELLLRAVVSSLPDKDFIVFNYFDGNGKIVNAKYRSLDKGRMWQHKGATGRFLYGLDMMLASDDNRVIICEGEFDALSFCQIGLNGLSVSQGAPAANSNIGSKLKCLENSSEYLKGKTVYIAVDNDEPGRYLEKILVNRFGYGCKVVSFPDGCKDANDVLVKYGEDALMQCFKEAKSPKMQGVSSIDEVRQQLWDIYKNGYKEGDKCGWDEVENFIKFTKGTWGLGFGMPGMGKSEFTKTLMLLMSLNRGWKWGVFSPEHHPAPDFFAELIELLTGKRINDTYNKITPEEFEKAMEFLNDHFYFIYPSDAENEEILNTPTNILKLASDLVLSKGIDGLIIDPYNQMLPDKTSATARDQYLSAILGMVDRWCKNHNTYTLIVHHTSKVSKNGLEKDFPMPDVYQTNGGAMWNNKAYLQYCVHRPHKYSDPTDNSVTINIQKVKKRGRMGMEGEVELKLDNSTKWYYTFDVTDSPLYGVFDSMMGKKTSALEFVDYDDYPDDVPF